MRLGVGRKVAEILAGSWRAKTPLATDGTSSWAPLVSLLTGCGAAGLGWWRIQQTEMRESAAGLELVCSPNFEASERLDS